MHKTPQTPHCWYCGANSQTIALRGPSYGLYHCLDHQACKARQQAKKTFASGQTSFMPLDTVGVLMFPAPAWTDTIEQRLGRLEDLMERLLHELGLEGEERHVG